MKRVMVFAMGILLVIGCGDVTINTNDDDGDGGQEEPQDQNPEPDQGQVAPSTVADIAGVWNFDDETYGKDATLNISQDGQVLGGTLDNIKSRHANITGTITSAGVVQMRFTFPKATTDCTMQVQSDTHMTGTWTDNRDGKVATINGTRQ